MVEVKSTMLFTKCVCCHLTTEYTEQLVFVRYKPIILNWNYGLGIQALARECCHACHLQVCQFCRLSESIPSSKLHMEVYQAEDSHGNPKTCIQLNIMSTIILVQIALLHMQLSLFFGFFDGVLHVDYSIIRVICHRHIFTCWTTFHCIRSTYESANDVVHTCSLVMFELMTLPHNVKA